jgi:hypothetical protein
MAQRTGQQVSLYLPAADSSLSFSAISVETTGRRAGRRPTTSPIRNVVSSYGSF